VKMNILIGVVASAFIGYLGTAAIRAEQGQSKPGPSKQDEDRREDDDARIKAGLRYVKDQGIDLTFKGRDRDSVGLGSYLVNAAGGCNDCHTAPPYTPPDGPYAGLGVKTQVNVACYLSGGVSFGPFVSRDITPWENGKPAGLSFKEFLHVIRTGEDPDNPGQVLQVMPWPVYQSLTDHDLRAIYDYLSSIPAIPANTCGDPSES
jgi:hypothetical protein